MHYADLKVEKSLCIKIVSI